MAPRTSILTLRAPLGNLFRPSAVVHFASNEKYYQKESWNRVRMPKPFSGRLRRSEKFVELGGEAAGKPDPSQRLIAGICTCGLFFVIWWIHSLSLRKMGKPEPWDDIPLPPELQQKLADIDAAAADSVPQLQEMMRVSKSITDQDIRLPDRR